MKNIVNPHRAIQRATIVLALLVTVLIAHTLRGEYRDYRAAREVILTNELADNIIIAANMQAQERGIISALLGSGQSADAATRAKLQTLRQAGDNAWQQADDLLHALPEESRTPLMSLDGEAEESHLALQKARRQIDAALQEHPGEMDAERWFAIITRFIDSAARLREAALQSAPVLANGKQFYLPLKRAIWLASEYAGRERAILAHHIGAAQPLSTDTTATLHSYRAIVEHNLAAPLALKGEPGFDPQLRHAIDKMEENFLGIYDTTRRQVYAEGAGGHYSIDAMRWFSTATASIDSILNVGQRLSELIRQDAGRNLQHSRTDLILGLLLMLIALITAALSFNRAGRASKALAYHKELAEMTLNAIGDAVMTTDVNGHVTYLNTVAEGLVGLSNRQAHGQEVGKVFNISHLATGEAIPNPVESCMQWQHIVLSDADVVLTDANGKEHTIEYSAAPIKGPHARTVGVVLAFYKVGEGWGGAPQMLSYYATHDSLTGLLNRREFERRLADALHQVRLAQARQHALCYIDLDQFKVVNDTAGHIAGDKLLCQLTYLLKEKLGNHGLMARLGGDEFGIILEHHTLPEAEKVAEELRQAARDFRFIWENRPFTVGLSIGVVPITADSINPVTLLSEADTACIAAKEKGRNRIQVYEPGNEELQRRHSEMHCVSRITEALKDDRFMLQGQRIQPLKASLSPHFEVLVRMLDEDGEMVPPMSFIPAAEHYNLMADIDRWVIRNSLQYLHAHVQQRGGPFSGMCNINISANSLGCENFQQFVFDRLAEFNLPPQCICFEITETAAMINFDTAIRFIKRLRKRGCKFALDDFGSGMSSLSYLKELPVDFLKIDGSLVRHIVDDPVACSMVEAICRIGHVMNIHTIAEYVENDTMLARLKEIGVDYAQGYGVARPTALEECLAACGQS